MNTSSLKLSSQFKVAMFSLTISNPSRLPSLAMRLPKEALCVCLCDWPGLFLVCHRRGSNGLWKREGGANPIVVEGGLPGGREYMFLLSGGKLFFENINIVCPFVGGVVNQCHARLSKIHWTSSLLSNTNTRTSTSLRTGRRRMIVCGRREGDERVIVRCGSGILDRSRCVISCHNVTLTVGVTEWLLTAANWWL